MNEQNDTQTLPKISFLTAVLLCRELLHETHAAKVTEKMQRVNFPTRAAAIFSAINSCQSWLEAAQYLKSRGWWRKTDEVILSTLLEEGVAGVNEKSIWKFSMDELRGLCLQSTDNAYGDPIEEEEDEGGDEL